MMKLSDDIITLFKLFNKEGYKLYIVGGAVRDYLLGRDIEDYDFATSAPPSKSVNFLVMKPCLKCEKIMKNGTRFRVGAFL